MSAAMTQSPGGCQCSSGCSATITGTITGCNSINVPGVTAEAHDSTSGGTLLGSATTNSSGAYSISVSGATAGNSIVVVFSHTRFTTATTTLAHTAGSADSTHWKCGAPSTGVNKTLSPATGYHCYFICGFPIKDTLNFTDTYWGSGTLSWVSGTSWQGTLSYSYPGCGLYLGCAAVTLTLMFATGSPLWSWKIALGGCPDDTGPNTASPPNFGATTSVCYIPGTSAFSATMNWGGGVCINAPGSETRLFCCNSGHYPSGTTTITE